MTIWSVFAVNFFQVLAPRRLLSKFSGFWLNLNFGINQALENALSCLKKILSCFFSKCYIKNHLLMLQWNKYQSLCVQ